ncbi:MAG: RidA family protein [Rhodospirillaceae bacterium]|jgi:enamine deaminase RidA (YjgF/YER057c/UK114 family)|nr:RidA family protein [Rhodospirillaceae bacterium]MBT5666636.1 RidA family protein [Rhodospirillaceae bacterium]MBT5809915.1 RidA family protein [Rhodospirillaceae bacterium]
MSIERLAGSATGRNRAVSFDNIVFTVATAGAPLADLTEQTRLTLAQLDKNLADAGSDKSRILSATVYITDISKKADMDAVWNPWIGPDNWPQRACIGVALAEGDLVEITLVAAKSL